MLLLMLLLLLLLLLALRGFSWKSKFGEEGCKLVVLQCPWERIQNRK